MSISVTLPTEYGYVLATATGTFLLATWHGMRIGPFRKAAKIPYPTQYASDSLMASTTDSAHKHSMYLFNCAQRAHYNFLENYVTFLPSMLIAGLRFPVASSALGAAWIVFRTMYATGYTRADRKDGKGRLWGSGFWLVQLALYGMCGTMAWKMVV